MIALLYVTLTYSLRFSYDPKEELALVPITDSKQHIYFDTEKDKFTAKSNTSSDANKDTLALERLDDDIYNLKVNGKCICTPFLGYDASVCFTSYFKRSKWIIEKERSDEGWMIRTSKKSFYNKDGMLCLSYENDLKVAKCDVFDQKQRFEFVKKSELKDYRRKRGYRLSI